MAALCTEEVVQRYVDAHSRHGTEEPGRLRAPGSVERMTPGDRTHGR